MPADNNSTDNWWWSNFLSAPDGSIKGRWRECLVLFPVLAGSFTPSLSFSSFTLYSVTLNSPNQLDLEGNGESRSAWSIKRHVLSIRGLYADKWAGWALLKDWSDGQGASGHLAGLAVPQLKVLCDFLDAHAISSAQSPQACHAATQDCPCLGRMRAGFSICQGQDTNTCFRMKFSSSRFP